MIKKIMTLLLTSLLFVLTGCDGSESFKVDMNNLPMPNKIEYDIWGREIGEESQSQLTQPIKMTDDGLLIITDNFIREGIYVKMSDYNYSFDYEYGHIESSMFNLPSEGAKTEDGTFVEYSLSIKLNDCYEQANELKDSIGYYITKKTLDNESGNWDSNTRVVFDNNQYIDKYIHVIDNADLGKLLYREEKTMHYSDKIFLEPHGWYTSVDYMSFQVDNPSTVINGTIVYDDNHDVKDLGLFIETSDYNNQYARNNFTWLKPNHISVSKIKDQISKMILLYSDGEYEEYIEPNPLINLFDNKCTITGGEIWKIDGQEKYIKYFAKDNYKDNSQKPNGYYLLIDLNDNKIVEVEEVDDGNSISLYKFDYLDNQVNVEYINREANTFTNYSYDYDGNIID